VILNLSADNMSATGGQFAARGRLAKEEVKIDTTKLWREAEPGYLLTLKVPTGGEFVFGGGLCSDYLEASAVDHCITASGRNGQPVLQADYASKGVGAFCLRLVCHITKATRKSGVTLAYTVLIFPGTGEEVLDVSDLAASPSWPGLKAADGEMALLPLPSVAWGCPVLPLLRTGSPWEDEPTVPPPGELIMRLSWIMATSEPADVCKKKKAMFGRWQRFGDNRMTLRPRRVRSPGPNRSRADKQVGTLNTVLAHTVISRYTIIICSMLRISYCTCSTPRDPRVYPINEEPYARNKWYYRYHNK